MDGTHSGVQNDSKPSLEKGKLVSGPSGNDSENESLRESELCQILPIPAAQIMSASGLWALGSGTMRINSGLVST